MSVTYNTICSARHTTQELKIICKPLSRSRISEILADGPSEEQDEDHSRGNPERAVEIRIALEHIEEIRPRVQRRPAPRQHGVGIDIEELRVEGQ